MFQRNFTSEPEAANRLRSFACGSKPGLVVEGDAVLIDVALVLSQRVIDRTEIVAWVPIRSAPR